MYKKMSKKTLVTFLSLTIGALGLMSFVNETKAANYNAGPLEVTYSGVGAMFAENNLAPGDNSSKIITVKNKGSVAHSFSLAATNVSGTLSDVLYLKPTIGGTEVWSKSIKELSQLPQQSQLVIPSIDAGGSRDVELKYELASTVGNEYQNKTVKFDLVFGNESTDPAEPTVTPTATATSGGDTNVASSDTTGGTGGGIDIFGRLRRLARAGNPTPSATATETVTASPTPTATVSPEGEVKGEQTDNAGGGENWLLLLITPIIAAAVLMIPTMGTALGVGLPAVAGATAIVLSFFYKGNMNRITFWIILILEIIIALILNYYLLSKDKEENSEKPAKKPSN